MQSPFTALPTQPFLAVSETISQQADYDSIANVCIVPNRVTTRTLNRRCGMENPIL